MLEPYHLQNKRPDLLDLGDSYILADLSQTEGQICRGKLFDQPPWCAFQCLVNEASVAVLQDRKREPETGHRGLTMAKTVASVSASFFSIVICCGYAFANAPYGDVFNNRVRELLVYFGTAVVYDLTR